jgi:hypothetical protein
MDYRDKQKEEKEAPKRHFDTIVKAVATGIFILSIFLNLVFVVLIIILGSALGAAKYGEKEEVGYKKVYSETWYAEKGTRKLFLSRIEKDGCLNIRKIL